jgi:hypothetical protein
VAWYDPTTGWSTLGHFLYVSGALDFLSFATMLVLAVLVLIRPARLTPADATPPASNDHNLVLVAATSVIGFVITITIGVVQASLANRYFTPLVPPAMLALTLMTQQFVRQELAGLILAFSFMLPSLNPQITGEALDARAIYGYEQTSDFVQGYRPDQLVFLWDHPAAKILDQNSLRAIGGYFMKRAGQAVPVKALIAPLNSDPNAMLREATANSRRPAFIWLYDTAHRAAAHDYPPTFDKDPNWICRHRSRQTIRSGELGSIACVKLGGGND